MITTPYLRVITKDFDFDGMKIETIRWKDDKGKEIPLFKASNIAIVLGYLKTSKAYDHCKKGIKLSLQDLGSSKKELGNVYNDLA